MECQFWFSLLLPASIRRSYVKQLLSVASAVVVILRSVELNGFLTKKSQRSRSYRDVDLRLSDRPLARPFFSLMRAVPG